MTDSGSDLREDQARIDAAVRLARAERELFELTTSALLPGAALDVATAAIGRVVAELQAAALPGRRPVDRPDLGAVVQDFFAYSPVSGRCHPMAPPIELWAAPGGRESAGVEGRATFNLAYEGPPTCLHGGIIALVFDELLGSANLVAGHPGMTGTLAVTYRRPTPLGQELSLRAWVEGVDGRKVTTKGQITHLGEVTAEATGLFIAVDPLKMLAVAKANADAVRGEQLLDASLADAAGRLPTRPS